jgi:hypothetical protein
VIPGSPATATMRSLLTELGEAGRTGALHVGGRPGGVLYLLEGRIAYAETPACPGIGERLVASGRVSAPAWSAVVALGRPSCRVGHFLLRDGLIGQHELALRVTTTICDATHELLQSDDDGPVRFVESERHWLGSVTGGSLLVGHNAHRVRLVVAPSPQDGPR